MTRLLGIEDAADRGDGLGGSDARRLIQNHPAVNGIAFLTFPMRPAFSQALEALAGADLR